MSVRWAVRVETDTHTDRHTISKLLHPSRQYHRASIYVTAIALGPLGKKYDTFLGSTWTQHITPVPGTWVVIFFGHYV